MIYWSLIIGTGMIAFTVALHTLGAVAWLGFVTNWHRRRGHSADFMTLFLGVISTAMVLIFLHFLEILLWAVLYIALPDGVGPAGFSDAIYFSMITFTTVGYGDITLTGSWNLLTGMEAMVGITVFGLTTALLYAVIQRLWNVKHGPS